MLVKVSYTHLWFPWYVLAEEVAVGRTVCDLIVANVTVSLQGVQSK